MSLHHEDGTSMRLASFLSTAPLGAVLLAGALGACRGTATPLPVQAAVTAVPRPAPPVAFGPAAIDEALRAEWSREGITPAGRIDDARFLRRVYLDVVGTVPPGAAVSEFMADASP